MLEIPGRSDEKLLRLRARIETILIEEDVAGIVVLHNQPGQFEIFSCIEPSYSVLEKKGHTAHGFEVRIRSKLADYKGDKELMKRYRAATANMLSGFIALMFELCKMVASLSTKVDEVFGAEHTPMVPAGPDDKTRH